VVQTLRELIRDLDRCPHGRHYGDDCAGWKGPSIFEGGCMGGKSLGNPYLQNPPPGRIGTTVHGFAITLNDISHVAKVDHRINYGIARSDGEYLLGDGGPATEQEAREAARQDDDLFAHVVEIRTCDWVDAVRTVRLPDPE
jgi:hypothetical protein